MNSVVEKEFLNALIGRYLILVKYACHPNTSIVDYTKHLRKTKRTYTIDEITRMEGKWDHFYAKYQKHPGMPFYIEHVKDPFQPLRWREEIDLSLRRHYII